MVETSAVLPPVPIALALDLPVPDARGTLSKGEFARLIGVTPGRVSQYIGDGKIAGDALVGEGREQRIHLERAKEQLRKRLDISQRLGNGINTRLAANVALQSPQPPAATPAPPSTPLSPSDAIEEQIKRGRLETLQRQNRKLAEDEAARAGRYVDAENSKQQLGRVAGQMMTLFEGSLAEIATAFAAHFKLPQRDVAHLLRSEFRKVRALNSATLLRAASAIPPLIEDAAIDQETEREAVAAD